jgi:hypothetical protein
MTPIPESRQYVREPGFKPRRRILDATRSNA